MTKELALAGLAAVVFIIAIQTKIAAQGTFSAGDKVMASPSMIKDENSYRPCTVIKFDSTANAYLLDCGGAEYYVQANYIRPAKNQPENKDNKKTDGKANPPEPAVIKPEVNAANANGLNGKFKVGDRVLASPRMLKDDKYYQPCTVIGLNPPNSYALRCDPHGGISFEKYSVREDFVKAGNVGPAPTFECSFEKPPAVNKKSSPASAAVFKHVIYEWEEIKFHKTRVGIKFETFQIGNGFKNVYLENRLLYSGFPAGVTIYPVKTRLVRCVEGMEENTRYVMEYDFACGKNRAGEWSCGIHETPREVERHYLQKDNKPQ